MKTFIALLINFLFFILNSIGQNTGINTATPAATLDINGDVIMRPSNLAVLDGTTLALNVNTARFSYYRIAGPTADFTLAGITAGIDGRLITLFNRSGFTMQLNNADAAAAAADMIVTGTNADITIPDRGIVNLQYDGTEQKWIVKSSSKGFVSAPAYWSAGGNDIFNINSGNIGVGINIPDPSALLDVSATDRGILIPRMSSAQKLAITSPATGLMIYQTDAPAGFWYFDGLSWKAITIAPAAPANFRYSASTSQAISANTNTKVNFGTPSFLNNFTFNNSTFTALVSGTYHFSTYLYIFGNNAGNLNVSILVNNVVKAGTSFNIAFSVFQGVGFSDNVVLLAGDQVIVQVNANATMAITVGQSTFFTGYKIN